MSEILTGSDGPIGPREPAGGWVAPLVVVVVVALLASGVFSSDPEPLAPQAGPALAPVAPATVTDPATTATTDDQGDFVEFGFDSQHGVVGPRGQPAAQVPAVHPSEGKHPARRM